MTQNIQAFYREVRANFESLPEGQFFYMMSLTDPTKGWVGGVISQVNRDFAAKAIVRKSHRIATPDEVASWEAAEAEKRKGYQKAAVDTALANLSALGLQPLQPQTPIQPVKPGKEK